MKILFIGDVVAKTGRRLLAGQAAALAREAGCSLIIANVENIAGGAGVTPETLAVALRAGVDVATSGNHVFAHKEAAERMADMPALLRPANYPADTVGRGWLVAPTPEGIPVGVINLQGRVFMDCVDCPFRTVDNVLASLMKETGIIIVDFHAEATSEKEAMARYLDGRVTALVGTHTHVQTADERVLPGGTAFIADVGMTGCYEGVIGTDPAPVLRRLVQRLPARFAPLEGKGVFSAVVITADTSTGRALAIQRIHIREEK